MQLDNQLQSLAQRIDDCMICDRPRLRRQLRSARRRRGKAEDDQAAALNGLRNAIDRSAGRVSQRRRAVPLITWPEDLPVVERREEIARAIRDHQVVIVCGQTGSGKTTQLPKICLELGRGITGMIGHTQPRRIAARNVASRIASELKSPPGKLIGYKMRFSDNTSRSCLLKVMTDGILLNETRSDRLLRQYDTIIIDEAHERSLNIDLLLGYLKRLLPKRPDLKVIITSATIDPQRFSEHYNDAPIIEVSGRMYPVEVRYRPLRRDDSDEEDRDLTQGVLDAVDELLQEHRGPGGGDVLVFLPGEREIREVSRALRGRTQNQAEILPLYARLSAQEQDRIFKQHDRRRIVLATNVAETSLTVPGIRYVIDSGLARISRYSARRKVQLLPVEPISQASADQRKGRCGRVADGICVRLYSEDDYRGRPAFTDPEITRANLASVILQMHALGLGDLDAFPFVEPPRSGMVRDGYQTLHELHALDEYGELTDLGAKLARLPVDPRIGRMLFQADHEDSLAEVLIIASALSVQDLRLRPHDQQSSADAMHRRFVSKTSDFIAYLRIWKFYHRLQKKLTRNQLRRACQENYLSFLRMREWIDVHRQLKQCVREAGLRMNSKPASYTAIHRAVLSGLLSNIAVKGDGHSYKGSGGKELYLFPGSALFDSKPRWIVAAELLETTRLYARVAARIQPRWLEDLAGHLVKRGYSNPRWDPQQSKVVADEKVSLFGLQVVPRRRVHYGPIDPVMSRELFVYHALAEGEYITDADFFEHNRKLIQSIEQMEDKRRRSDLLADASARFAFYDKRIPHDIYSGRTFERWRRKVERTKPQLLYMTRDDLLQQRVSEATAGLYPSAMEVCGIAAPLTYRHDPGHPEDGVTVELPLQLLNQVDRQRLEWLVPGYLREKVIELIKTLPKDIRRNYIPAPDFADAVIDRLEFSNGSLIEAIGRELVKLQGIPIDPEHWQSDQLPDHLRMNIRVVDNEGQTIAMGRDLSRLRKEIGDAARQAFAGRQKSPYETSGNIDWVWGDLPQSVAIDDDGLTMTGYPAVIDEGPTAGTQVFDDPAVAASSHRHGLRRLFLLRTEGEILEHVDELPDMQEIRLLWTRFEDQHPLEDQLALLIADRAFLGDDESPLPRSRADFVERLEAGRQQIWAGGLEVARLVSELLQQRHAVELALDRSIPPQWSTSIDDITEQLRHLFPRSFLINTLYGWLYQYPRYLRAIVMRIEKLPRGGFARDQELLRLFRPYWEQYLQRAAEQTAQGIVDPHLEYYRWLLEEWRVALFAQDLGTAVPVSERRLAEQWQRTRAV